MYSSQRALSFLPELKRNEFAWDILNQSHRFSMFWKKRFDKRYFLPEQDVSSLPLLCAVINVRVCVVFLVLLEHVGEVGEPFVT